MKETRLDCEPGPGDTVELLTMPTDHITAEPMAIMPAIRAKIAVIATIAMTLVEVFMELFGSSVDGAVDFLLRFLDFVAISFLYFC